MPRTVVCIVGMRFYTDAVDDETDDETFTTLVEDGVYQIMPLNSTKNKGRLCRVVGWKEYGDKVKARVQFVDDNQIGTVAPIDLV